MNESSVSSPFMSGLRKRFPDAEIIKHHDASHIGLLDCSVTHGGRTFWFEFKLFRPGVRWDGLLDVPAIAAESPTQLALAKRLNLASGRRCLYIVWVKKGKRVVTWNPEINCPAYLHEASSTSEMIELIAQFIEENL